MSTVVIPEAVDGSLFPAVPGRFAHRTVLLTGGGGAGIGGGVARAFAAEGAQVCVVDRDMGAVESTVASIHADGGRAVGAVADVRSRDAVEAAFDRCEADLGAVNIVINHAGVGPSDHTLEIDEQRWRNVVDTNLTGVFHVAQAAARRMHAANASGVIVNMASTGGIATEPGHAHYAASKAGILALTRVIALELADCGIRVHALCPGDVASYRWPNIELARIYRGRIAAGRSATVREIVAAYLFLASEDARAMSGCALVVDGGMLAWE